MMGQQQAERCRHGVRTAVLALSWVVTLGASGCVRQHSQRSDSWNSAEEPRADVATRCVDAEHESSILDLASSSGRLAPQKIRDVMQRQRAVVSACFEASIARQSAFKGTVTLLFAIEPDGSVSHASVLQSDLADCEVTQCLRTHVARLSFPAPEGGAVTVQYPISVESQPLSAPMTASRR